MNCKTPNIADNSKTHYIPNNSKTRRLINITIMTYEELEQIFNMSRTEVKKMIKELIDANLIVIDKNYAGKGLRCFVYDIVQ